MSGRATSSGTIGAVSGADIHAVTANSLAVGVWTVFARLTGLGRVVAIAAVLGPTYFGNLFQATNSVPNLIYEFLAGNLIISLLVPRLVPHVDRSDHAGATRIAGQFLAVLLTLFAAVAAATILAGPLLLDFLSFGVADPVVQADQRTAGWLLLLLLVPQVLLYAVAGVGMAVQHSYGRYRLATAAYSAENVGVMAVVISSAGIFGSGVAIGDATTAHLVFLGVGTTAAVALHAGVQWWGASRVGMLLRPRLGWRSSPEFKGLLSLCVPSLGYAGMNALRLITLIAVANSIPGGVVAFQMAMAFYYLPIAVGARPVAWAMVPHLARVHKQGPRRQFQSEWAKGFSMSAFVVVPAVLGYAVLATPMARAFSLGEMATTAGIALVAAALLPLAFGIPGETMFIHASHALYARSDARRPLRGMAMRVGLTLIGIALTAAFVEGKAVLVALGCTVALADLLGGGYLASRIVAGATDIQKRLAAAVGRSVIAAAIMAVPVYFVGEIGAGDVSPSEELAVVIAAVGLGAAIYLTLQRVVFHSQELELLSAQLRSLLRRRPR